jgi:hypothetical protein
MTLRLIPMSRGLNKRSRLASARAWHCALILVVLVFPGNVGVGQASPQSFWELRPEATEAMLHSPSDDTDRRYIRLRQYFADLHCTSALMEEQAISKHRAKNLICILPGKDAEQIVVAARYDRRSGTDDPAQGWTEAVTLPILYNALLAGHRQHTFVFAELCGTAGEDAFVGRLHGKQRPLPMALVVMDALGRSGPWYYTSERCRFPRKAGRRRQLTGGSSRKLLSLHACKGFPSL